jgi:DNA-binding GntR family transcriptional regulator
MDVVLRIPLRYIPKIMSLMFERIEPISKKTRVVRLLREAILSGAIKGGEPIVEAKLAQQFGVGQGLVREALIELEHHGFVQRTPFTGTTVTSLSLEDASTYSKFESSWSHWHSTLRWRVPAKRILRA